MDRKPWFLFGKIINNCLAVFFRNFKSQKFSIAEKNVNL